MADSLDYCRIQTAIIRNKASTHHNNAKNKKESNARQYAECGERLKFLEFVLAILISKLSPKNKTKIPGKVKRLAFAFAEKIILLYLLISFPPVQQQSRAVVCSYQLILVDVAWR